VSGRVKEVTPVSVGLMFILLICLWLVGGWACVRLSLLMPPPPEEEASPVWSPDGKKIAFECYIHGPTESVRDSDQRQYRSDAADICVINVDGSQRVRLTSNQVADTDPTWSPDGTQLAYISVDGVYVMNADGTNQRKLVHIPLRSLSYDLPDRVVWSPSGKYLAFSACREVQDRDIYVVNVHTGEFKNLTAGNAVLDTGPAWMPDSRQLVFLSSRVPVENSCDPAPLWSRSYLKLTDLEGTLQRTLCGEAYYDLLSVSSVGQIAFVANMRANNYLEEGEFSRETYLYLIDLGNEEPIIWDDFKGTSWSPNGRYLTDGYDILDVQTGEKRKLPLAFTPHYGSIAWSPNGENLATTGSQEIGNIFAKRIIILDLKTDIVRPLIPRQESP
jgi:dipeptidyl aminopeptidase/acylaminoacyl peptidase